MAASSSIGIGVSVTAVAFSLHQMPVSSAQCTHLVCPRGLWSSVLVPCFVFSPFIPTENLYLFYKRGADCKVYHINLSSFSSAHTAGVECVVLKLLREWMLQSHLSPSSSPLLIVFIFTQQINWDVIFFVNLEHPVVGSSERGGHILVNKQHWRCIFCCLHFWCEWLSVKDFSLLAFCSAFVNPRLNSLCCLCWKYLTTNTWQMIFRD